MRNIGKKLYFDIIYSIGMCVITGLAVIGQIVFIVLGLIRRISDWGIEGILEIGLGAFGPFIGVCLLLLLFSAFTYWRVDEDGITNGNIFGWRKIKFCDSDRWDERDEQFPSLIGMCSTNCFCLYKGRKRVLIPTFALEKSEIEWLKEKSSNRSI